MNRTDTKDLSREELQRLVAELEDELESTKDELEEARAEISKNEEYIEELEDETTEHQDAMRNAAIALEQFGSDQINDGNRVAWRRLTHDIATATDDIDSDTAERIALAGAIY